MTKPSEHFSAEVLQDWQERFAKHPEANLLQSPEWASVSIAKGDEALYEPFGENDFAMVIVRHAKRGRYLEIPAGPLIDWSNQQSVKQVFTRLRQRAKEYKCGFIRFRPAILDAPEHRALLARNGCRLAPMHLGAQNTVHVDLTKTEDELLASFRRQTRYEVRQAIKKGIIVEKSTDLELFRKFHAVQVETARRQHFIPPDFTELSAEHEAFGENAVIYLAKTAEGEPIAYGLILKCGLEADYFEAASTELGRKLPGAYALQWQVIRNLKAEGYQRYNLFGIAPPNQPNHRYAGVTTFKTGFGETVNFVPAHDIIISPLKYRLNSLVETARKKKRHL